MRTVKVIEVRFLEDDIWEGSIPAECYENAETSVIECDDVEEAVRAIERTGCTFESTGADWASDPDGSYISNYATAERIETSCHLEGWSPEELATIIERVR